MIRAMGTDNTITLIARKEKPSQSTVQIRWVLGHLTGNQYEPQQDLQLSPSSDNPSVALPQHGGLCTTYVVGETNKYSVHFYSFFILYRTGRNEVFLLVRN